jgi:WD40 repeat protein
MVGGLGGQATSLVDLPLFPGGGPCTIGAGMLDGTVRVGVLHEASAGSAAAIELFMVLVGAEDRVGVVCSGPTSVPSVLGGSNDGVVRLWHLDDASAALDATREVVANDSMAIPCVEPVVELRGGHDLPCQAVALGEDERAVSASYDGKLAQWDLETGTMMQRLVDEPPSLCLCTHGGLVFSATAAGSVRAYDLRQGRSVGSFHGPASEEEEEDVQVNSVCSLGGNELASGGCDGTVRVWDVRRLGRSKAPAPRVTPGSMEAAMLRATQGRSVGRPGDPVAASSEPSAAPDVAVCSYAHRDWVYGVCCGPERSVWSASADGTVRRWGLDSADALQVVGGEGHPSWLAIAPTSTGVVMGGVGGVFACCTATATP